MSAGGSTWICLGWYLRTGPALTFCRYDDDQLVVMCMDWTMLPETERPSNEQWEDDLGGIASAGKTAKHIYLLNKNFK